MSWMEKLYQTYESNVGRCQSGDKAALLPVSHSRQQAHIEIVLDGSGAFKRAELFDFGTETVIPVTEKSAGRTTNEAPHPLSDKIQYVAKDYSESFGGKKRAYFTSYLVQLEKWCAINPHPKAKAVLSYVKKGTLVADLVKAGIMCTDARGTLLTARPDTPEVPKIFKVLPKEANKVQTGRPYQDQGNAFVRWRVETPGVSLSGTWEDPSLIESWADFDARNASGKGVCFVTGKDDMPLAKMHPKRLRHAGDGARLISSNDHNGYTYRGRFVFAEQAVGVASEVTQKAHSALRWLIQRQAFRHSTQTVVAWAVSGKSIPDPLASSDVLFNNAIEDLANAEKIPDTGDVGQSFGRRLSKMIAGYKATLGPTEGIVVMGLDSASLGRIAVTFYREMTGSEFLERIIDWHETYVWFQQFTKNLSFVGVPAPKDIAEAAYGRRLDDKLLRLTIERLLPCITDRRKPPWDLVQATIRRTGNRIGMEHWEWEKSVGIACALFKGFHKERQYSMSLEADRRTRDYLYGRLLAIAERIEGRALYLSDENRDTTAARLMQRFADHPYTTWLNIEKALQPYKSRLHAKDSKFLFWISGILDEVHGLFNANDYMNDRSLTGEYLLGYHCQRQLLHERHENGEGQSNDKSALKEDIKEQCNVTTSEEN